MRRYLSSPPRVLLALGFIVARRGSSSALLGAYQYLHPSLPDVTTIKDIRLQVPLRVYSRDGKLIAQFGEQRRIPLAFDAIPNQMINAVLAAEDDNFFQHGGVDYPGLMRATVRHLLSGEKAEGGSTITMQLARGMFLSPEKSYRRKLLEIFTTFRIEQELTKQEILALYLNKMFLGQRAYGVGAAAEVYFGKTVEQLTLPEIALIAGTFRLPSRDNPVANADLARQRRALCAAAHAREGIHHAGRVRHRVERAGRIAAARTGCRSRSAVRRRDGARRSVQSARRRGVHRGLRSSHDGRQPLAGRGRASVARRADRIRPASRLSRTGRTRRRCPRARARRSSRRHSRTIRRAADSCRRWFFRSTRRARSRITRANGRISLGWPAISWARAPLPDGSVGPQLQRAADVLAPNDVVYVAQEVSGNWRMVQVPDVQGAFVAVDPQDGAIAALTGGFDYFASNYNRAVQAKRQPGSAFKPFLYSAALEQGFTPASIVNDAPLVIEDPTLEGSWRPQNVTREFRGPMRLREALVRSRNLVRSA